MYVLLEIKHSIIEIKYICFIILYQYDRLYWVKLGGLERINSIYII
jgi:hypothetical protein